MARINYDRMAAGFERGRSLPLEALDAWRDALRPYLSERR
jgi:hypothetical protein